MSKDKINDYSTTANSNQDIGGTGILGTNAISNFDNAFRTFMKHLADWAAGTSPVFDTATFCDPSDQTKEVRLDAGSVTAGQTRVLSAQDTDGIIALLNVQNQAVTGGGTVTSLALNSGSAVTTGTLTLDVGDCPLQHYTNGGAHTLAPGSVTGSALIDITNNGSAGSITTSGWTKVSGDSFTTTNAHKFRCSASVGNGGSLLVVQALQ